MLLHGLSLAKHSSLPAVPNSDTQLTFIYLSQADGSNAPGVYVNLGNAWTPFGSGGKTVVTKTIQSNNTPSIDVIQYVGSDGLLLSALVHKLVPEDKSITLVEKSSGNALETVTLTKEYTSISVPQPYSLYTLMATSGLEIIFKIL